MPSHLQSAGNRFMPPPFCREQLRHCHCLNTTVEQGWSIAPKADRQMRNRLGEELRDSENLRLCQPRGYAER
jgi:hypothetical protein